MATSKSEGLASTPTWIGLSLLRFTAGIVIWGLFMLLVGSLSFYVVGYIYPEAMPFLWLAVIGSVISLTGFHPDEEGQEWMRDVVNTALELNRTERFVYVSTLLLLVIGTAFAQISAVGIIAAFVFHYTSLATLGITVAIFLPPIDSWLGRNYDLSIGTVGFMVAAAGMRLIAFAYRVSPDIVSRAEHDIHSAVA